MTPLLDVPTDKCRSALSQLDDSSRQTLEPALLRIMKCRMEVFEKFPRSIWDKMSSSLSPEIDLVRNWGCYYCDQHRVPMWCDLLKFETSDGWSIKNVSTSIFAKRIEFFLHSGSRICHFVPDIWFERAQYYFSDTGTRAQGERGFTACRLCVFQACRYSKTSETNTTTMM